MKHKLLTISLLAFFFFLSGCQNIFSKKLIREGIATFTINYETTKEENPIVILLPHKMYTYFKDDKSASIVEGFFGTFRMVMLNRPDLGQKYTIVRILDKKYIYETNLDGKPFASSQMQNMKIKLLDTSFVYKGFNCKAAAIYCPSIQQDTFLIYYTTDLGIKYANVNTPYYQIPGVLVKFKLKLLDVVMDISLEEVASKKIEPTTLEIPKEGYKYVSYEQLEEILNSLQ